MEVKLYSDVCYDVETKLAHQLKTALREGAPEETIEDLKRELFILTGEPFYDPDSPLILNVDEWPGLEEFDYWHVSGWSNPIFAAISSVEPPDLIMGHWSFIASKPDTVADAYSYKSPGWFRNLNAMSEKMFESYVFKSAAKWGRCVVPVDAYYESHHFKSKTYPFRISAKSGEELYMAAIYRRTKLEDEDGDLLDFNSIALVTCKADENSMMAKIHNSPTMLKRGNGHRMLVMLSKDQLVDYLKPYPVPKGEKGDPSEEKLFQQSILDLCRPFPEDQLKWHTVRNLKDRKEMPYIGNVEEITQEYHWEKLEFPAF